RRGAEDAARSRPHRRARRRGAYERTAPLLPAGPRGERARHTGRDRPIDVLTHPALAHLHPTGNHPERAERLAVLLQHQHVWSEGRSATEDELLLVHARDHVERVRAVEEPTWLDGDTIATATTFEAASLAAGTAIEAALRG